jgi:hypothetical protein
MSSSPKTAPWPWFFAFAFLFSLQVVPRIFNESPTNDEPLDITDGYFYWKGDMLSDGSHPVFLKMLQALPLRTMALSGGFHPGMERPQFRAYDFFFVLNKGRFERMVRPGRFLTFLFGWGIGLLLFFLTRKSQPVVWVSALALWAFEPTLLAFSGNCGSDVPAAFLYLASILAFQKHLENPGPRWSLTAGTLAAMAVCSKLYTLFLIPSFAAMEVFYYFQLKSSRGNKSRCVEIMKDWFWGTAALILFISAIYFPGTLLDKAHRFPLVYFGMNLAETMRIGFGRHPSYFLGQASRHGHWLYFPLAFALKTTLPFFVLTVASGSGALLKKITFPAWIWIPPVVFLSCILPVQNLGVRYLLPAFPFLILMGSRVAAGLWKWETPSGKNIGKWLVGGLLAWHAVSVSMSAPDMMGYFNDFVPVEKKMYYLGDSNLDIGQDVGKLAEAAREKGWKRVKLAQFGGALDPSFYGLAWFPWTQKDLRGPQPGNVYAVNLSLFQLGPEFVPELRFIAQGWASTRPPTGRVGDAWIYFEVPGEPQPDPSPAFPSVRIF